MSNDTMEKWENTRKIGIVKYVLFRGLLLWGLVVGAISVMIYNGGIEKLFQVDFYQDILPYFIIQGVIGVIIYFFQWRYNEKRFLNGEKL